MDPVTNPYAPGAGSPPPELAGRDDLREQVRVSIARIRISNPSKSLIMVGLRGVGKTVLLDQMRRDATTSGVLSVQESGRQTLLRCRKRLVLLTPIGDDFIFGRRLKPSLAYRMAARTCFTRYGFACGALPLQIDPLIHAALPNR